MPRTRGAILHALAVNDAAFTTLNEALRSAGIAGRQYEVDVYADNLDLISRRRVALLDELAAVDLDAGLDAFDHAIQDTEQQIIKTFRAAAPDDARHLTDAEILAAVQDLAPPDDAHSTGTSLDHPRGPEPPASRADIADALWEGRLSPAEAERLDPTLAGLADLAELTEADRHRRVDLDCVDWDALADAEEDIDAWEA